MTLLATFKHISSKNADYGAAEQYLTFEHDEFTMKPTLDENGRLMLREDYRIATLNCGDEDFAVACMRSNLRYGKNQKREDVKSHHYIISFDPRDAVDNGLTVDRAQALGEEFCRKQFPGHQAIVCTHPDGHNHSGNIHVHIVINSLRIEEVPLLPYMDRPADTRAGCKHRCTDAAMEYFKAEVMEMCHRENLYQIDLLHGSKNRITEREYWAQKKGQAKLDKENATLAAEGQPVKQTKFETDKAKLRQTIRNAMSEATTFDEFSALLLRQGVIVKESRGRLSYLAPDRTKPITARKLGDDFDRAAVLALLEQNAHRAAEKTAPIPEYHTAETNRTERGKTQKIAPTGNIQRMVDRAAKRAEGKGIGYDRWAAVHNLKQMAATVAAMEQYGFTPDVYIDKELTRASKRAIETLGEKDIYYIFTPLMPNTSTRIILKKPKTDSSIRKVWLPKTLAYILREWKKSQDELKGFLGDEYQDFDLVVALPNGRPCEDRIILKEFAKLREDAGLPKVVFHSLRHSSTTYKLKLNHGDLKATQGDTGHAEIDMITSIYAHILDEDRKVNAQKFETAFYAKPDLRNVRPPEEPAKSEPATLDLESLVEQLQKSPELASALAALIAAQAPAK